MTFNELGLAAPLVRALSERGYAVPTPIQAQAIPAAMKGLDVLGCAQTGTGKTAAFALPLLHRLIMAREAQHAEPAPAVAAAPQKSRPPQRNGRGGGRYERANEPFRPLKVLILAPTRELAVQIAESTHDYGEFANVKLAAIYGGVGYQKQIQSLRRGIDILVATPGRLVDLLDQGYGDFSTIEAFVLDEADRMLDMGFLPDLRKIIGRLPNERQTLFFSATMPPEIARLANDLLVDPFRVSIAPEKPAAERIDQTVCFVPRSHKSALLTRWLADHQITRAIVFTKTKHGADRVARQLEAAGVPADAIHGNKSQNARQRALQAFRDSSLHVLVATDLAARGIDVDGISHVFNYDLPIEPETYVHRIGRTARAGASGIAVSFCDRDERGMLKGIERLLKRALRVETNLPVVVPLEEAPEDREMRSRGPRPPRAQGSQFRAAPPRQDFRSVPPRPAAAANRPPTAMRERSAEGQGFPSNEQGAPGGGQFARRPGPPQGGKPRPKGRPPRGPRPPR